MQKIVRIIGGISVLAMGLAVAPQVNAQADGRKYICHEPSTTVVLINTSSIQPAVPIIRFALNTAKDQGWDNLTRCRAVASNFDRALHEGKLKYLVVTSIKVRQGITLPVFCGLKSKTDTCDRTSFLYTILNPNLTNPESVMKDFLGISKDATAPVLLESTDKSLVNPVSIQTNEDGEIFVEMEQVILYKASKSSSK